MGRIGNIVAVDSRLSFIHQRLGSIEWPARYPGMRKPFINIAGALADFIAGATAPKANRFYARPALIDTGALVKSIKSHVIDAQTVEVRSDKDYGALQFAGGLSSQNYSGSVQDRIRDWLFERKQGRSPIGRFTRKAYRPRPGMEGYVPKMAPLIRKTVHTQRVIARPFIGVTDHAEAAIRVAVVQHFRRAL